MSEIIVTPVSSRREKRRFLELPWVLHRDDPNWIPPLRGNQKQLVGYKPHPFYDSAEAQTFIAARGGRVCGRVAAIVNHAHNKVHREKRGFLGFFESINDPQVAHGLFESARSWFAARDIHTMRGPANPSLNYECALLVEGNDSPPTFMMPYNPLYYGKLWEEYGFKKAQDLFAYWGHVRMLKSLDEKLGFIVREARRRFGIQLRSLDRARFIEDVCAFLDIYNKSLAGTWGAVPLSQSEIERLAGSLRHLIVPELATVAEIDGRMVGACFGLLDYNPVIKRIDGRLFPLGFWHLLRSRRRLARIRLISTNVLPEYQRWGIGLVLLDGLLPAVFERGIQEAEFSWVLETNHLSRASLERGGATRSKTYRMYDFP